MTAPLLSVRELHTSYPVRSEVLRRKIGDVRAVSGVDLSIRPGEALAVVGESGCGKTTLARTIVGLETPSSGSVTFDGHELVGLTSSQRKESRRTMQMIFQDPFASLNPRRTVAKVIGEGWEVHPDLVPRRQRRAEVERLLKLVGLDPSHADRYPHQFSGGQQQRIGIARALALRPKLLICDEPVSALDVSVQAQVLNLLRDLKEQLGLAYLIVAHDLAMVRATTDRVVVMYLGKVVEQGTTEAVFTRPSHPYTQALISAAPSIEHDSRRSERRILLTGDVPSPLNPPSGCVFRTRCRFAQPECAEVVPILEAQEGDHEVACHFVDEIRATQTLTGEMR